MTPMLIFHTIANQIVAYRSIFINFFYRIYSIFYQYIGRCFFYRKMIQKENIGGVYVIPSYESSFGK